MNDRWWSCLCNGPDVSRVDRGVLRDWYLSGFYEGQNSGFKAGALLGLSTGIIVAVVMTFL